MTIFSTLYTDGSNSFSGFEIKSRKSLGSVERSVRKCMLRGKIDPVAFLCSSNISYETMSQAVKPCFSSGVPEGPLVQRA